MIPTLLLNFLIIILALFYQIHRQAYKHIHNQRVVKLINAYTLAIVSLYLLFPPFCFILPSTMSSKWINLSRSSFSLDMNIFIVSISLASFFYILLSLSQFIFHFILSQYFLYYFIRYCLMSLFHCPPLSTNIDVLSFIIYPGKVIMICLIFSLVNIVLTFLFFPLFNLYINLLAFNKFPCTLSLKWLLYYAICFILFIFLDIILSLEVNILPIAEKTTGNMFHIFVHSNKIWFK